MNSARVVRHDVRTGDPKSPVDVVQATAWKTEHGRMARALQAEVGPEVPLDAVLAASGGDVKGGQAPWRGRAAQIGLLTAQLAAAKGQRPVRASPPDLSPCRATTGQSCRSCTQTHDNSRPDSGTSRCHVACVLLPSTVRTFGDVHHHEQC